MASRNEDHVVVGEAEARSRPGLWSFKLSILCKCFVGSFCCRVGTEKTASPSLKHSFVAFRGFASFSGEGDRESCVLEDFPWYCSLYFGKISLSCFATITLIAQDRLTGGVMAIVGHNKDDFLHIRLACVKTQVTRSNLKRDCDCFETSSKALKILRTGVAGKRPCMFGKRLLSSCETPAMTLSTVTCHLLVQAGTVNDGGSRGFP